MNLKNDWGRGISTNLARLGSAITAHPWRWLLSIISLTLLLAINLLSIRVDSSIESFLAPDSPVILRYEEFKELFGVDNVFIVSIEVDEIFAPDFVQSLRSFHNALESEVPYIDRVDSLVNARYIYGENDSLVVQELFDELPTDATALEDLKAFTYDSPFYKNYLLSDDRHLVSVIVKLVPYIETGGVNVNLNEAQMIEAATSINKIIANYRGQLSNDIQVAGGPSIQIAMGKAIERDFTVFSTLAIVIICAVLSFIFKRASGVIMPVVVMGFGVVATISTMALLDTPLQMTTAILPSFLMAVCIGDSIHLLTIFYMRYDAGEMKEAALKEALEKTGVALFFTSITTAAGLATFSMSGLFIVSNLGVYAAAGSIYAFVFTILILPCLIVLLPLKRRPIQLQHSPWFAKVVSYCARITTVHPIPITVIGVALFVASSYLALQLNFSQDGLKWLPEDHPVRIATEKTEERMSGTIPIEIVIDTGVTDGATDPARLQQLDKSLKLIGQWEYELFSISKAIGLSDIIKETNRALNDNDDTFFRIPADQALIRQELLLLEMDAGQYLYQLTDPDYRYLRVTVMVPWLDAVSYGSLTTDIEKHFTKNFPQSTINVTGLGAIMAQTFVKMLSTTTNSYLLAFIIITAMMIILMGDLRVGLAAMLPNLLPIAMTLALMNLLNLPLDIFTLMIGSIAVGLTVDDTVHFMHHFRQAFKAHGDAARAVSETLYSTGRALSVTTLALALGFLVYTQSTLHNLQNFGLLTSLCIVLALVADFLLAPALMVLLVSNRLPKSFSSTLIEDQAIVLDAQMSTLPTQASTANRTQKPKVLEEEMEI